MGATQLTVPQLRAVHANRWLATRPFHESKNIGGRMIYQTTKVRIDLRAHGQASGKVTGLHLSAAAAPDGQEEHVELKKQPQTASQLVFEGDLASVVQDPKQLMTDLVACGLVDAKGAISESFYDITDHSKMGLPDSYAPVLPDVFRLLTDARRNYYTLGYDIVMGEHRAGNPLSLFRTIDTVFSRDEHPAIHTAWTQRAGELKHSLLAHILSVEKPSIDPAAAIGLMTAWFKDTNHCPVWALPGQSPVFHSYDFELASKSGMAPHTDVATGNNVLRTHHFKLEEQYLADIVKGLEGIGHEIGKRVNINLPDGSQARRWNHSSQVEFMLYILDHVNSFGTPNIKQEGDG